MRKKILFFVLLMFFVMVFSVAFASSSNKTNKAVVILEQPETNPEFILPESVQIIEDEAFEGTAIVKVELPETVTTIGERAFANISTLLSIRIPPATKTIASTAFAGSNHVTINAIPDSYARTYAKNQGLPFSPIATFCALAGGSVSVHLQKVSHEVAETDSTESPESDKQWRKLEEIKVVGTLDIIYNSIQGRGPPMV